MNFSFVRQSWFWVATTLVITLALGLVAYRYYYVPRRNLSEEQVRLFLEQYRQLNDNANPSTIEQRSKDSNSMEFPKILGWFRNRQVEEVLVCFGDVCPQNGGYYLRYSGSISREDCVAIGGAPIVGFGWSEVYAGCGVKL